MTREDVLQAIRAHLADELELDPARIDEGTHFKNDLEADSLDLYTLVQELEDTYGVAMSDEQAAKIHTVGQAVDFVIQHHVDRPDAGGLTQGAGPDAPRSTPSAGRGTAP
jgi:acyl carrier protein